MVFLTIEPANCDLWALGPSIMYAVFGMQASQNKHYCVTLFVVNRSGYKIHNSTTQFFIFHAKPYSCEKCVRTFLCFTRENGSQRGKDIPLSRFSSGGHWGSDDTQVTAYCVYLF